MKYLIIDNSNNIIGKFKNEIDAKEFQEFVNSKYYKKEIQKPTKILIINN
jgi:hypothetical protein